MRNKSIDEFINLSIHAGGWMILDKVFLENRLKSLIGDWQASQEESTDETIRQSSLELLDEMLKIAESNKKIVPTDIKSREALSAELLELLTPPPSVVNALFSQHYDNAATEATDYFHLLNINNGFVKNTFPPSEVLDIEKSNWVIQPNQWLNNEEYVCQQCFESEGFGIAKNRLKRIIRMNLKGDSWGFSFEPTPLFNEHCQFFPEEHLKFEPNRQLYENMLRLIDIFPHYFISFDPLKDQISSHSSFFGGAKKIPLFAAEASYEFSIPGFVTVSAALVDWPLSVIRLKTTSKKNLLNSIEYLTLRWQQYSYPSLDILAKDNRGHVKHSLIPIFRMEEDAYVADLVLVDEADAFKRTTNYENLLADKYSIIDQLGIINVKEELEVNGRLIDLIKENILKQSIFKDSPEGETAFIRFVDTL